MRRHFALLSIVPAILFGGLIVGCGGDDSDGQQASSSLPAGVTAADDEKSLRSTVNKSVNYVVNGNAKGLCSLFVPGEIDKILGKGKCVKVFKPGLSRGLNKSQFKIEKLEIDGDEATVTFGGEDGLPGFGYSTFVRVDGDWYLQTPETGAAETKTE